jgi:hypothetical protein
MGDENEAYLTFSIAEELTVAVLIYIWCLREQQLSTDTREKKKTFLCCGMKYNLQKLEAVNEH